MRNAWIVVRRELASYFATPLAYVFILIFVALSAALAFFLGGFFERGQADLQPFFAFHPWLYLFLVPAVSMRLWAEERQRGTIELLLTLPVTPWQAVLGKFLAAWAFIGIALGLTFPMWITVNYLGDPDNGVILAAYLGSLLMAGGFLAVGCCASALTRNQVVAFILGVVACFLLLMAGYPLVLEAFRGWAPAPVVEAIASLSFLSHFEAIAKGVLDLRDLLFFAMLIGFFLFATRLLIDPLRGPTGAAAAVALAVIVVAVTIASNATLRGLRLDLTANRLYTTSPGTLRIVESLREPVSLQLFYSAEAARDLPAITTHATRVREFLEELAERSGGRIRLEVVDPRPFSEEEDKAAELGLREVPLGRPGQGLYLGLAGANSVDGRATIDFFDPSRETFLEYDVAKLLQQLGEARRPVVGWLSGIPMDGGFDPATGQPGPPWLVLEQARQLFDLRMLSSPLAGIPEGLDVLVVVHPHDLPASALWAIDQFALAGGRVLLFVDPVAELDAAGRGAAGPTASRSSSAAPLLAAWGVSFDPGQVVVDLRHGMAVGLRPGEPPVRHIGILGLDREAISATDVVTANLPSINVASVGALAPARGAGTRFEPLLQSSTESALVPAARFDALEDPETLLDGFRPSGRRYTLAARITGNARSAFGSGPPQGAAPAATTPLGASGKPLNVIVVADTDLLADFLWVREQGLFGQRVAQAWAGNGDFALNAIDNLGGSADLIGVRGRAQFARPFERVEALRRRAETRLRAKEQELEAELATTEQKLAALEAGRGADASLILSPAQQAEIGRFQAEKLRIRKELRDVRLELDEGIRALGNRLRLINVAGVPLALGGVALLIALWRRRLRAAILALNRDRSTQPEASDP